MLFACNAIKLQGSLHLHVEGCRRQATTLPDPHNGQEWRSADPSGTTEGRPHEFWRIFLPEAVVTLSLSRGSNAGTVPDAGMLLHDTLDLPEQAGCS